VEHRLFSFISTNWRGEPLRDYETIVRLIAKTTTATGLNVTCRLDRRRYPVGRKVTDAEFATVRLYPGPLPWRVELRDLPPYPFVKVILVRCLTEAKGLHPVSLRFIFGRPCRNVDSAHPRSTVAWMP
jgi:hypothetical protein